MKHNPGIGATDELSLRVSVATLVRVIFKHPIKDEWMLALERKATLHKAEREQIVEVKSQPFGGAILILDVDAIHDLIGDFHFDSEHSHTEQDFRIFIRPSNWSVLREFCIQHLSQVDDPILETDPTRELAEEFAEALKITLKPEQYVSTPVATVIENEAVPTDNVHAEGSPTVRVYRIFEAVLADISLIQTLLSNSKIISDQDLSERALNDVQNGGAGWATSILVLPLNQLRNHYLTVLPTQRNLPVPFEGNQLDETVTAILEEVPVPKYQRL